MKGIKRSTSDYVEFTDAKKWYDWKKKTMITAASHGVADVLNPKYRPMDRELFREQSIFMFAVFKLKLGTLKAKNIMSQFEKRQDAQGLWKELCNKHEEGMGPEDLTNQLQDKWKYFKCDHRWTRTHESFLDNWALHLREYEEAKGDEISDDERQRVLRAAIAPRPLFHSCTTNGQLLSTVLRAHGVTSDKMTYPVFFELVCAHAKTLDQ